MGRHQQAGGESRNKAEKMCKFCLENMRSYSGDMAFIMGRHTHTLWEWIMAVQTKNEHDRSLLLHTSTD
jgi:hypothetical protein